MSLMLEGLVTTLLSLDYLHQKQPDVHKVQPLTLGRCRSNSLSSSSSSDTELASEDVSTTTSTACPTAAIYQYHSPPERMSNYDNNDTVFGSILRGDLPAVTLAESSRMLAIEDIKPRAPLHALVIPKAFVGSVFDLEQADFRETFDA